MHFGPLVLLYTRCCLSLPPGVLTGRDLCCLVLYEWRPALVQRESPILITFSDVLFLEERCKIRETSQKLSLSDAVGLLENTGYRLSSIFIPTLVHSIDPSKLPISVLLYRHRRCSYLICDK